MFKRLSALASGEYLSALTVVLVATITGARAAEGMNALQWAGGASAVVGSIAWAVIVRAWPVRARA